MTRTPPTPTTYLRGNPVTSLAFALAAVLAGCGGEQVAGTKNQSLYPVKGQVLLPNGKPLTSGTVVFVPKEGFESSPRGVIGSDGNFTITTNDQDGAPVGEYKVRLEPAAGSLKTKGGLADLRALPFPARYADSDGDTGLTATVKAEPATLEPFKLTAAAPRTAAREHD